MSLVVIEFLVGFTCGNGLNIGFPTKNIACFYSVEIDKRFSLIKTVTHSMYEVDIKIGSLHVCIKIKSCKTPHSFQSERLL